MKLIPITQTVTPLTLEETNVLEGEGPGASYNAGTTYGAGDVIFVGDFGTLYYVYRSLQAGNLAHDPATSPAWWEVLGTSYLAYNALYWDQFVFLEGHRVVDTTSHRTYESLRGTTATVTLPLASPGFVNWPGHGLKNGDPVLFRTTNTLPTGLLEDTIYYVKSAVAGGFNVEGSIGGVVINFTGATVGTHTGYGNPNFDKSLTDPDYWFDIGPTNRYAMFDASTGSQTTNPEAIIVVLNYDSRIDRLSLLNVSAATVSVQIGAEDSDGFFFDETFSMSDPADITDWYAWFFEPIVRKKDLLIRDILPYGNVTAYVTISEPGGWAAIGALLAGLSYDLGGTMWGFEVGTDDYSRAETDPWGNTKLIKRGSSKRASLQLSVPNERVDAIETILDQYTATPAVWEGTERFAATWIYGWVASHRTVVSNARFSVLSIDIKGFA